MTVIIGAVPLIAQMIKPIHKKINVNLSIPTSDNDLRQHMGFESKIWEVTCVFVSSTRTTDKNTLKTYYEDDAEVDFTDDENNIHSVKIIDFQAEQPPWQSRWDIKMILREV